MTFLPNLEASLEIMLVYDYVKWIHLLQITKIIDLLCSSLLARESRLSAFETTGSPDFPSIQTCLYGVPGTGAVF